MPIMHVLYPLRAFLLLFWLFLEQSGRGVSKIIKSYGRDAYEFRENSIVIKILDVQLPL